MGFPWLGFRARQGASKVADLVLQAAHAAGCENQTPLAAVPWNGTWNWMELGGIQRDFSIFFRGI
jgi:hypothetical protein